MALPDQSTNDDLKKDSSESSGSTTAVASGTVPNNSSPNGQKTVNSSTSISETKKIEYPGQRKENPLSKLSSYTYAISLYMVSPEVMNAYNGTGGQDLKVLDKDGNGIYLIAQSGGINNSENIKRIPNNTQQLSKENGGVGLDYFIDDLTINTLLPGGPNKATVSTEVKFKIIEPTGVTFLQDIAKASNELFKKSAILSKAQAAEDTTSPLKQHFILGIRFYGYDVDGNLLKSSGGSNNEVDIQRYFPIKITNIKFKLDGKTVAYNCEALVVGEQAAYGQINATIKNPTTLIGSTVGDVLIGGSTNDDSSTSKNVKGLMKVLTDESATYTDKQLTTVPNTYSIQFLDGNGKVDNKGKIASAKLIDDATFVNTVAPMSNASSSEKVTIAESFKSVSYDSTKKVISLKQGQNILTVIDNIIVKSNYVTNALTEVTSQDAETDGVKKSPSATLSWYSVNPLVKAKAFDPKTKNWAYDITYQIQPYDIAYIRSAYVDTVAKYPGPYKVYEYWLTGKNTEILSYEQQYDSLFYMVMSASASGDGTNPNGSGTATAAVQNSGGNSDATTGGQNRGSQINENVRANLYSPGDQGQAKIKILGDPDYIMPNTGLNAETFSKFYGKSGSINPFGGQVFIQISFKTANDYLNNGLLDVSSQLQFYKSPEVKKAGIEGIVYMVTQVDSSFSRGTFTQTLECLMVDESRLLTIAGKPNNERAETQANKDSSARTPTPALRSDDNQSDAETTRLLAQNATNANARKGNLPAQTSLDATAAQAARTAFAKNDPRLVTNNTTTNTPTGQVVNDDANVNSNSTTNRSNSQNNDNANQREGNSRRTPANNNGR